MTLTIGISFCAVVLSVATGALACSPLPPDERTSVEIIRASQPIRATAQCGFVNGGVYDGISAADAEDLGDGRVVQKLFGGDSSVLLVDCETREATMLSAPADPAEVAITTCGPSQFLSLLGPDAIVDLSDGPTLSAVSETVKAAGGWELNPVEVLNTAPWGKLVPRKDRVDLLCGCRVFYPDSRGGG